MFFQGQGSVTIKRTDGDPVTVFTEPVYEKPSLKPRMSKYERVLAPMMEHPEQWAKIGEYKTPESAYQAALNLRKGTYTIAGEPSDWEFVAEDSEVFARYTPQSKKKARKS